MKKTYFPPNYKSVLEVKETQIAIKVLREYFQSKLAERLELLRVSAPLFLRKTTGLNDMLSGKETPVSFKYQNTDIEIVQSLAKWKRFALYSYGFSKQEGIYTDMNAIRQNEELDNTHSIYVDQWDWEKIIPEKMRNKNSLKSIVEIIYSVFTSTADYIMGLYPKIELDLPKDIFFIEAKDLEKLYPNLSPDEREKEICREKRAVFIIGIGHKLNSGIPHSMRAADYDDWDLNGDLILWNEVLDEHLELSSMGIRVDYETLVKQNREISKKPKEDEDYYNLLKSGKLPQTVGGGIGQSRVCMYFLKKAHIGEVQSSVWDNGTISAFEKARVKIL